MTSNIVPSNFVRFDSEGLELVVDTTNGKAYASISATARMLETPRSTIQSAILTCRDIQTKSAEIPTNKGLQAVEVHTIKGLQKSHLIPVHIVFQVALKYDRELAIRIINSGVHGEYPMTMDDVLKSYHEKATPLAAKKKQLVYIIQCPETKVIKIGISHDPLKRIAMFQTGYPYKLELIRTIVTDSAKGMESALHKALSDFKLHGEWFDGLALMMIGD